MALRPMSERLERPPWVRRVNSMAAASGGARNIVPLDVDELMTTSLDGSAMSGFGDLGDGDWEARLRALVDAINSSSLHVVGRLMTREELLRSLRTRASLGEFRRQNPDVRHERIESPLVVTGPARSGTTILFELLALDPTLRVPRADLMIHPVPPPVTSPDERMAMTECEQELWADVQPEFAAMHELRSDLPVECVTINVPSFAGGHWLMVLDELGEWFPDPVAEFAYHRSVLQVVQFGLPRRSWVLKTPAYITQIDDLLAAYPDARIIQTHRDPAKTMPSTVSITATVRWMRTDDVPLDDLSLLIGAVFTGALNEVSERRRAGEWSGRFGDVPFTDLLADPVSTLRAAYGAVGRTLTDDHAAAIVAYLAEKPQHAFGVHRYTPEEWGFDRDTVRADLAAYISAHHIVMEN